MHENEIGRIVVDCAIPLHQDLGPGLLETVYEVTLARKLEKQGLLVERRVPIAIEYDGQKFDEGFRPVPQWHTSATPVARRRPPVQCFVVCHWLRQWF